MSCGSTTVKGTTSFDLEGGKAAAPNAADIWWQQIDATHRYMVPQNGSGLYSIGIIDLASVTMTRLESATYSQVRIRGTRTAPAGTIGLSSVVAVKTRNGHFSKLRIDTYGWDLGITWVTYANG
jgi:hypothetical protein